jgi:hypothetical protein
MALDTPTRNTHDDMKKVWDREEAKFATEKLLFP